MTDASQSPADRSTGRPVAVGALAATAAVAGLLQLIAGVALGLATPEALHRAAREGPRVYILIVLALATSSALAWALRTRPRIALGVALAGPTLAGLLIWRGGVTRLGLAYHGEFILHHFLTLVCAALCVVIPLQWLRDGKLGRPRWLPAAPATAGAALLLAEHLLATRAFDMPDLWIDVGVDDPYAAQSRDLHTTLERLGVSHVYHENPGTHSWEYWVRHAAGSAAWLAGLIAPSPGAPLPRRTPGS